MNAQNRRRRLAATGLTFGVLTLAVTAGTPALAQEAEATETGGVILSAEPAPGDSRVVVVSPAPSFERERNAFFKYRALDFMDIFTGRVSGAREGRPGGFYAQATWLAQLGLVYFNGHHSGQQGRAVGVWRERRMQAGIGPLAYTHIDMRTVRGNGYAFESGPWAEAQERGVIRNGEYIVSDGRTDPLALGLEIQPGILPGFEVRFAPLELVDFLLGFARIDIYSDDLPAAAVEVEVSEIEGAAGADGATVRSLSTNDYEPGDEAGPETPAREITPGQGQQTRIELRIPARPGAADETVHSERIKSDGDVLITHRVRLSVDEAGAEPDVDSARKSGGFMSWIRNLFGGGRQEETESVIIEMEPAQVEEIPLAPPPTTSAPEAAPRSAPLEPPSELGSTEDVGN